MSLVHKIEVDESYEEPAAKKMRKMKIVDDKAFDAIKVSMDKYDASRELIIKKTRDIQKLAKWSIFSQVCIHFSQV
jgi:hypothetical protein